MILLSAKMARSAQKAAEAASEEAAGAWRPVVLPESVQANYFSDRASVWAEVRVRNAGNGPALDLRLSLSSAQQSSELPIPTAVLPAASELNAGLELPAETTTCELTVSCFDLGTRLHTTRASVRFKPPELPAHAVNFPVIEGARLNLGASHASGKGLRVLGRKIRIVRG